MNTIIELFNGHGVASSILFLGITAVIGVLIGKVEINKIRLGIAGVLFAGLAISHLGAGPDARILGFVREFGLILFVYAIGLEVGPRFFSSFKSEGLTMNLLAVGLIVTGFAVALAFWFCGVARPEAITGILCGAVFNTPSLGSAQQAMSDIGGPGASQAVDTLAMGFAVSYPFGVIGVLLAMVLLRFLFRIDVKKEEAAYRTQLQNGHHKLESVKIHVSNPNLFGRDIGYIKKIIDKELVVSRIERDGRFMVATDTVTLAHGDMVYGVSSQNHIDHLHIKIGNVEIIREKRDCR
ncbi:MAG: hypothetical protein QM786_09145 [Breznakibacter sp.]